ncbi:hypothetical protein RA269_27955, partial [Pseudomonas syringae pv. tagetis]|uniref:hypothetical protein n=1 Tax=Pseudomonas syringae group genomosp. 7 TaxID=251699 RepID=UPI00376FDC2F
TSSEQRALMHIFVFFCFCLGLFWVWWFGCLFGCCLFCVVFVGFVVVLLCLGCLVGGVFGCVFGLVVFGLVVFWVLFCVWRLRLLVLAWVFFLVVLVFLI